MIKMIHSYWAYVVLIVLVIATVNAIIGLASKKEFKDKDLRLSLFSLIASHIQLIIGIFAYFFSTYFTAMKDVGMGGVMKNSLLRQNLVEHPLMVIIAIVLITIGFSKHKKKTTDASKFKTIAVFYTVALILILAVIPWKAWFTSL